MNVESIVALALFAFVSSITPGPNNLMILASGLNFGFVRSIPHWLGISVGFSIMLLGVGSGLHTVFTQYPWAYQLVRFWVQVICFGWRGNWPAAVRLRPTHPLQASPWALWVPLPFSG
jgi:threonine/homoserine/homoserine lactone efflux protein